jgi:hypothetical protein
VEPLRRIQRANRDVGFIYTYVLADGGAHFVLDAADPGDADGDGIDDKAHVMEGYPDTTTAMIDAIRHGRAGVDDEIETDKWGSYLSAYAPFYDATGHLAGAVGVDLKVDTYAARLARMRHAAAAGAALAKSSAAMKERITSRPLHRAGQARSR